MNMRLGSGERRRITTRLGLAAAIAVAALSGVAQARTGDVQPSSPSLQRAAEAAPIVEVDFQLYKRCACPERYRTIDVKVKGSTLAYSHDTSWKGDGVYGPELRVTNALCDGSKTACWLWTHEHKIKVGPTG